MLDPARFFLRLVQAERLFTSLQNRFDDIAVLRLPKTFALPPPKLLEATGAALPALPTVFIARGERHPTLQIKIMSNAVDLKILILTSSSKV